MQKHIVFNNPARELSAILDASRSPRAVAEALILDVHSGLMRSYGYLRGLLSGSEVAELIAASSTPYGSGVVSSSQGTVERLISLEKKRRLIGVRIEDWPRWLEKEFEIVRGEGS